MQSYPYVAEDLESAIFDVESSNYSPSVSAQANLLDMADNPVIARRLISRGQGYLFFSNDRAKDKKTKGKERIEAIGEDDSESDDLEIGDAVKMSLLRYGNSGQSTSS